MIPLDWIALFREMGEAAHSEADEVRARGDGAELLGAGAGGDITSVMDKALEDAVLAMVPEGISVLTEEAGAVGDGDTVIIMDPLDGSHNAIRGIPTYSISIALVKRPLTLGRVEAGYIRHLITGDEWTAVKGGGAFRNGQPISPSSDLHTIATELFTGTPQSMMRAISPFQLARKVRCIGSVALDLAYLSDGTVDAFVDLRGLGRTFDLAAGYLILKEAGGEITDDAGAALDDVACDFSERRNILAAGTRASIDRMISVIPPE